MVHDDVAPLSDSISITEETSTGLQHQCAQERPYSHFYKATVELPAITQLAVERTGQDAQPGRRVVHGGEGEEKHGHPDVNGIEPLYTPPECQPSALEIHRE